MLVYICCAGGATSSLFCKKIGDASKVPTTVEDIFTVLIMMSMIINMR